MASPLKPGVAGECLLAAPTRPGQGRPLEKPSAVLPRLPVGEEKFSQSLNLLRRWCPRSTYFSTIATKTNHPWVMTTRRQGTPTKEINKRKDAKILQGGQSVIASMGKRTVCTKNVIFSCKHNGRVCFHRQAAVSTDDRNQGGLSRNSETDPSATSWGTLLEGGKGDPQTRPPPAKSPRPQR